jgi:formylglycine-generating enzyme required for sulfatase activity
MSLFRLIDYLRSPRRKVFYGLPILISIALCVVASNAYSDDRKKSSFKDPATGMEFVYVKGGCYLMGDSFGDGGNEEKPVHEVCVDDFYVGRYETTQGQWKEIMGNNPSSFRYGDNYPVEKIGWDDVREFLKKMNKKITPLNPPLFKGGGKGGYRLPSEAEWEYAAREGGRKVRFGNGKDNIGADTANFDASPEYKRPYSIPGQARGKTTPVGSFNPNGLGLYDMSGNVLEWVEDRYAENYYKDSPKHDPPGPVDGGYRALRGGSWDDDSLNIRATARRGVDRRKGADIAGFRVALSIPKEKTANTVRQTAETNPVAVVPPKEVTTEFPKSSASAIPVADQPEVKVVQDNDSSLSKVSGQGAVSTPAADMEFVYVRPGCFDMGDSFADGELDEKPVHEVCIRDFNMGKYEVTQGQWKEIMGHNPSYFKDCGNNCPVEQVSWNDVQLFIEKLGQKTGRTFRLPTEAEWEYAARNGGAIEKWAGTNNLTDLADYAWYEKNSDRKTNPIGAKKPNGLGLYDMSGNICEWVQDWYGEGYYSAGQRQNPTGPVGGKLRVLRGGSWDNRPSLMRNTTRIWSQPSTRESFYGFRLVKQ